MAPFASQLYGKYYPAVPPKVVYLSRPKHTYIQYNLHLLQIIVSHHKVGSASHTILKEKKESQTKKNT